MIKQIESTTETQVTVESVTVKDLEDVKIYIPVVSVYGVEQKSQYVFVYDKKTEEIRVVDQKVITKEIKATYY